MTMVMTDGERTQERKPLRFLCFLLLKKSE